MKNKVIKFYEYKKKKRGVIMCKILKDINGKTALELLNMYDIPLEPPIQLSKLLQRIGIATSGINFSDIEREAGYQYGQILGAAISKGENLTIFYRKQDTENRQRFTIAHELAHCCLHTGNLQQNHIELREDTSLKSGKEMEADIFAGELLIPESSLVRVYNQFYLPSLESLAKIFSVSTNVMAARLDYLSMPYFKDAEITYT
ncbi:MAG: ImmA/IrrE family metallo-endopeptidase [Clostridiales bacterium]|nr:ImmA/IrrE family metallo-endopeptidase [Proteus hauseri]MBS6521070.1 ImmA/IrrE family metallo-endopeptidase [Clostridiales bacterium]